MEAKFSETMHHLDVLLPKMLERSGAGMRSDVHERQSKRRSSWEYPSTQNGPDSEDDSDENVSEKTAHFKQEPLPAMMKAAGNFPAGQMNPGPSHCPMDPRDDLDMNTMSQPMQESLAASMHSRDVSRQLINAYLETINQYRHPIPKDLIFRIFNKFYDDGAVVYAGNITQFGLLAALCSIGALYVTVTQPKMIPELSKNGEYDELDASKRLCNAAQIACFLAQNMSREDIYTVLTYTHLSRLFFVRGQIKLSWNSTVNCVRVAMGIGLHRDGEIMGLDQETTHLRRIVWSLVYSVERTTALGYGRPMIICDALCDTQPPQLSGDLNEVPKELRPLFSNVAPPNLLLINNLRSKFALYIGDLSFEVQNVHKNVAYSRILQIHVAFTRFVADEVPFYLKIWLKDNELVQNTQCDPYFSFVKIQRYQLWLDFNFFVLALHCPYLLRYSSKKREKYCTSYEACIEAVKLNLALRRELLYDEAFPKRYRDSMAGFRWFNTVVVAGFILLKKPSASDAALLSEYMNEFMAWRANHRGTLQEQDLDKEIDIVRAFLDRAKSSTEELQLDHPSVSSSSSTGERSPKRTRLDPFESRGAFAGSDLPNATAHAASQPHGWSASDVQAWRQQRPMPPPGPDAPNLDWATTHDQEPVSGQNGAPFLNPMGLGSTNMPYNPNVVSPGAPEVDSLHPLYGMPMITPNVALNPQTLMPVWPQNLGSSSSTPSAPFFPIDTQDQKWDPQQLLHLW